MKKKKQAPCQTEQDVEFELIEKGWQVLRSGLWKHPNLELAWPLFDALRLQDEADACMQDQAHRMLRGEL